MALLAVATNSLAAGENEFRAGIAAYEAGQFDVAAQAFRRSLGEQTAVGTLVNLGLAEWQRGRPGDAILAWEQASWLNPFDRAAAGNLLYVHNVASVNPLELTWYEEASTWLPANWWTGLAGGSLWLAVALVTVPGFLRRRKAGWQQTVAAMALGIFLLSLAPSWGIFTRAKIAIVLQNNSALRLTPTQTAETFAPLPPGEPVRALRQRGNYFFVHTQIGNGWIDRGQIEFLCPN
jgi:tetratricopeptide (TPR) repeat protein